MSSLNSTFRTFTTLAATALAAFAITVVARAAAPPGARGPVSKLRRPLTAG